MSPRPTDGHGHMSSNSLATTHEDAPAAHTMTSPSTAHSSIFPGSLSSATSESAGSKHRSEFGMHPSYAPMHGSASSRASHLVSLRARSATESAPSSALQIPCKPPVDPSHRPVTAPNPPPVLAPSDSSPAEHHTRSHSRLALGIKNLFSRHALPSPSRFSFNSATTTPPDSEASSSSFQVPVAPGIWSMTPRKSRPPDLEISGTVAPAMPSPSRGSNSPIDAHRRYASEAAAKMYNARTGSGLPTSPESSIDVSFRNAPPTRGRDPKTRNVLRRRPSGSAKLVRGRERGKSSPSRPHAGDADNHLRLPPKDGTTSRQGEAHFPLTPAGAVVEAYKQQELHRDDIPSPPKLSIDDRMSSTASHDGGYDPAHASTPYYTVFASSSERRVKAGGPDDRWAGFEPNPRTSSHQPSMSDPGGRSLARKLSSRWRKNKGGGVVPEDSPLRDKGHSKGRPSLQELWGGDKSTLRAAGRSLDGLSDAADGALAGPTSGHARSGSKSEGPKLWRLMRRISTGGLRDRFQSEKAVPPVPAIPKELLKKVHQGDRHDDPLPTLRHQPSSSAHDKDHARTPTAPRNIAVARPSAATSSSSPNSSDVASAQFFYRSHSARSSVSSYGEAVVVPRAPEPILDRHIITPLEQLRLADDHTECRASSTSCLPVTRSPRRSTSVPAGLRTTEDAGGDRLPLPRQACSGESPSSGSSRRCSASPSVPGSARASCQLPGQARMADGIVALSPPPRPSRNSARGGSLASSSSHSVLVKPAEGIGLGGRQMPMDRTPSGRSDTTMTMTTTTTAPRSQHARRRPPLSEREKTAIWNELLARSDEAGGTLHIHGAAALMSDGMRLSTYSDMTSSS